MSWGSESRGPAQAMQFLITLFNSGLEQLIGLVLTARSPELEPTWPTEQADRALAEFLPQAYPLLLEGSPLRDTHIKLALKRIPPDLGHVLIWTGWVLAITPTWSEHSILRAACYILAFCGVLLMVGEFPKPRPGKIWIFSAALILGLCMLTQRRWIGISILVMYSLTVISQVPEWLAAVQRSLSHWRQSIEELNAESKKT